MHIYGGFDVTFAFLQGRFHIGDEEVSDPTSRRQEVVGGSTAEAEVGSTPDERAGLVVPTKPLGLSWESPRVAASIALTSNCSSSLDRQHSLSHSDTGSTLCYV